MKHIRSYSCRIIPTAALLLLVTIFLSPARAFDLTAPEQFYLMHSGGNMVECNSQYRAVLGSGSNSDSKMLTLSPEDDGYVTISTHDGRALSLQDRWDAFFITDDVSDNSRFIIETSGDFVKIRCKANSKYLGTNSDTPGSYVYCDKQGNDNRHLWYLTKDSSQKPPVSKTSYILNPDARRQSFEGWGVSLCWWANMCGKWSDDKIDEIIDWLVSPEGLNYNIFRYNIGGGDDPDNRNCDPHHMGAPGGKGLRAEMEGFKTAADAPYDWTRDAAQRKIMLKIKEKRPDAIFEAFSNSAPYYMTFSGCVAGNANAGTDNLRPECYEDFARYLVDVCKHYKDTYGIEFRTLDPFNEPMTSYWGANGGQEGCHFDVGSMVEFIKVLHPILKESGLSTVISATDETSVAQSVKDYIAFKNAGILDLIGQWNTHTYTADDYSRAQISSLCLGDGMPLWMSEVGVGGSGISGNLDLAQKLINDIRYIMPSAWVDWQYIEDYNDQWCLVQAPEFDESKVRKIKNYSVRAHFSRYIGEGYRFLDVLNGQTLAAINKEGDKLVIVAMNNSAGDVQHSADLSMFTSAGIPSEVVFTDEKSDMIYFNDFSFENGILKFELPGHSILTFVIPVDCRQTVSIGPQSGRDYLISPRVAADMAVTSENGTVLLRPVSLSDQAVWRLSDTGSGFEFKNRAGEYISISGNAYRLAASSTKGDGQSFLIEKADDVFYKITEPSGVKAFDLEGAKAENGTAVGIWNYNDSQTPVHRQWTMMLLPAAEGLGIDCVNLMNSSSSPVRFNTTHPGILTIESSGTVTGNIHIYNASGNSIYSGTVSSVSVSIPLASGIYIVAFTSPENIRHTGVVLIR